MAIEEAKEKPFANYELDNEVDKELRNKERFGDPMKLITSKSVRSKNGMQTYRFITTASGFKYILPKCKFGGGVNRFNVEPGHRWDGVDRSNGYERKWIDQENTNKDN
jgi:pre-mRNA-splicing factor CWC26